MFKQLNNDRGLVFVVIMMVVIVMITLTLSLISINISQVNIAEKEAQRVQSALLGPGVLSLAFTRMQAGISDPGDTITQVDTLEGTTYTSQVQMGTFGTGPINSSLLNATATF